MAKNVFSFFYEIDGKTYRPLIIRIAVNGVYFRTPIEGGEHHTSYHRDGRYHWVTHIYDQTNTHRFNEKRKRAKTPIRDIKNYVSVETRGARFTSPDFMEEYSPQIADTRIFEHVRISDNTNMFFLIGPDITKFDSRLPPDAKIKEKEVHTVSHEGVRVHVVLANFD